MSVQLIVYPQNYNGLSSASNNTDYLTDAIQFSTVNGSTDIHITTGPQGAVNYFNPTMNVNTWYRYYESISGTVSQSGIGLHVSSATNLLSGSNGNGIMQKLSGLTIGATYDIIVTAEQIINGPTLNVYSGTVLQSSYTYPYVGSGGIHTIQFTANSTEDTILISAVENVSATIFYVRNILIRQASSLDGDGQVICDLYEDEDIPLTLSVDEFKNVAEKVQSYSKAFNLPATKRNNRIFDNIFDITRSDDGVIFNPYKRTRSVLKQNGLVIFDGYLRLIDVTDKEGETSYNVNLYSEIVSFADTIKDKEFRDINLDELEHIYTYHNIRESWQGTLPVSPLSSSSFAGVPGATTTGVLRYPFVDWNHSYTIDDNGMPVLPNLESTFRPFIQLKYLINRIFDESGFTFTSNFFSTPDFERLFMDFNWGSDIFQSITGTFRGTWWYPGGGPPNIGTGVWKSLRLLDAQYPGGQSDSVLPPNYQGDPALPNPYIITATTDNEIYSINYKFSLRETGPSSTTILIPCRWLHTNAAGVEQPDLNYQNLIINSLSSGNSYLGVVNVALQTGDTLVPQFNFGNTVRQHETSTSQCIFSLSGGTTTSATLLELRGDLNQWDFIKGLITMFNLVTIPDENNSKNIIIEPYIDVFLNDDDSPTLSWTDKIDVSEMKLKPLTDLNRKTTFKFVEDDDDYAFQQYKTSVGGHLYGSKKSDATNNFNILDGEEEIVAEPFAATVVKSLMSQYPDLIVPAMYSYNANDDTTEGFENSPRIMYNNGVKTLNSTTYHVPSQNCVSNCGNYYENEFLQFSHLTSIPTTPTARDFHFGVCQLMNGVGDATVNNLFNIYWQPYFNDLYNPNTRTMTIKVNLNAADINTFKFNSTVFIKNRSFRVNKIDYKPNDLSTVEFILIP